MLKTFIICILAGAGAGFATGFSGISAALVISPMLISFLDFDAYDAIGVALLSDVLAAAESSLSYKRAGYLRVKDSLTLLAFVLLFTFAGSWVSRYVPSLALGSVSVFWSLLMGLKFLFLPKSNFGRLIGVTSDRDRFFLTAGAGSIIGFISGFAGAGGGMMTLFALTTLMDYDMKDAVGTSVFVMTFTALVGGVSHISIGGLNHPVVLVICTLSTLLSAVVCSRAATKVESSRLTKITGIFLTILGTIMFINYFFM